MKKILLALLCAAALVFGAVGCVAGENTALSENENGPVSATPEESEPSSMNADTEDSPVPDLTAGEEPLEDESPDNSWQLDTPENHGVDGALLNELYDEIAGKEIRSVVIVKDGYIISEYYKQGYDENSAFRLNSCTKSFSGALIGIAIDKGLIDGVDARLDGFFPQLAAPGNEGKREITLKHLLTHTSGLYWNEWNGGPMFGQLTRSENWVDFVLNQQMACTPGSTFNYTTGGSHLLAVVLQQAAGETAYDFAVEQLFRPLGMDSVRWSADPQGVTDGGNGISMTARDAAKFGQLYLNRGKWRDIQVISEAWIEESTKYQAAGSYGTGEYGYQWWLKSFGKNNIKVYYAMGYAGQYIFVAPDLELVAVITSRTDTYAPQSYFNDYIIAACDNLAEKG